MKKKISIFRARWALKSYSQSLPLLSSALCPRKELRVEALRINFFWNLSPSQLFSVLRSDSAGNYILHWRMQQLEWKKTGKKRKKPLVSLPLSLLTLPLFVRNSGFQTCKQLSGKREEERKCKQRNYGRAIAAQRQRNQPFQGWQQQHFEAQTVMRKREHMRGRGGLQSRASKYSRKAWVSLSVQPARGWLSNRGTAEIEVREGEMGEGERSGRW